VTAPSPHPATLTGTVRALHDREVSSEELVVELLRRADRLDPALGVYLARFDESATAAARAADRARARGDDVGALHGVPLGIKDMLAAREGRTTAQSLVLDRSWGAGVDATAVARLRRAGAIVLGKTTTSEFAFGTPDPAKPFPIPHNPWDLDHAPGGSSSGSAIGIAAGLFPGGLGTDTGGSVRIPSAFCGITGLKPTFGRVPVTGCVPLAPTLDTIGPMAATARDCALLLGIIAGGDDHDPTSARAPAPDYVGALDGSLRGVRIGVEREHTRPAGRDPAVDASFEAAVSVLGEAGATVVEVSIEHYDIGVTAAIAAAVCEAFAWHRRSLRERWFDYGAATRAAIGAGALHTAADYAQAQRVRGLARRRVDALWEQCDAIVMPTAGVCAPALGSDVWQVFPHVFTAFWNGTGLPALSVPMGFGASGLPLGLQIAGPAFHEAVLLRIGDAFQQRTDWHLRRPALDVVPAVE
jgi:aspartyl-tRNA(Asn)/glutamyl-tRNA(Gln) amidotransferase subunit A